MKKRKNTIYTRMAVALRNLPGFRRKAGGFESLRFGTSRYTSEYAMKLSAVYRCVDCISQSVAQLPLEIFSIDGDGFKHKERTHPLYMLLNKKPNERMTRHTLLTLWVQAMLLDGNGYGWIKRDGRGMPQGIIYLPPSYVSIIAPLDIESPVTYQVSGIKEPVAAKDMIHIVNKSLDGVVGISTLAFASRTLQLSSDAEEHAANFFAGGCGVGGILKSTLKLQPEQAKEIKKIWNETFKDGTGGVAVLSADLNYQPVTVNPSDAQLLETREFNVIDICRFFGVSPVKAFDLSKSSYSTVEATNISFLTDTLSPLLEKIELELETKLFPGEDIDVRFDVSQLLRADKQSLANYYSTLFQIGAISPDEIRREIDLPPVDGGELNFVQVNLSPLKFAGEKPVNEQKTQE